MALIRPSPGSGRVRLIGTAATSAFEDFLAGKALNANQLYVVNVVIVSLTESGVVEIGRFYEAVPRQRPRRS